jgi:signal transduction histidine kinase/CheY-like chemotaxis protein
MTLCGIRADTSGVVRPRTATAVAAGLLILALLQGVTDAGAALYDGVIAGAALLLVARALLVSEQRPAWSFMAVGLSLWAGGDLYFTLAGGRSGIGSYAWVTDAMFVGCYPFFVVGLIALVRDNLRGQTGLILLDGLMAALATTSLALALLSGPATELIARDGIAYAPTIAYPVSDFVLLAFALGALVMSGPAWRPTWLLIAAGWALAGAADTMHVYDAAGGGYQFGSGYDFLWPLSTVVLAWAGWQLRSGPTTKPERVGSMFAFPSLFALPALGVFVYDHFERVGPAALVLATVTIVLVFARVGIALRHLGIAHEAQLRRRARDAQARRLEALGQLAGGVAHDFNNLLAVILNYSHFLAESLPDGDERREDAEEIGRTAERAATLAHQLLLFSRRDVSRPELVCVGPALAAMETMLRSTVSERVALHVVASEELPPVLLGAGQFDQVVLNLAVNARDAMPGGGRLLVLAEELGPGELPPEPPLAPGHYVRLTVGDTGTGMPEPVRERAFEPFFSTKSAGHGTGLGLATVYGIVEHAGGAIEIRSEEGKGTSVLVYLPVAHDIEEEPPRSPDGAGVATGSERVLVVEDEPALRLSTSRILSSNGYDVLEAADGEEALSLLAMTADPIDLLITDVVLPNLSGVELAERLHCRECALPVIYVSGLTPEELGDGDRPAAHGRLLLKPVPAAELLGAVRSALDEAPVPARDPVGSVSA